MSCVKLVNDPNCVEELLAGLEAAFPALRVLPGARTLLDIRTLSKKNQRVALLSGGGSGHEPFCAGYVGPGMLTAAVAGSVFASPPATNIYRAVKHVTNSVSDGVLLIIPNYTGDCLNFGLAAELAKKDNIKVESVIVGEDCALLGVPEAAISAAGRRGLCGLAFVYKIAGQQAAEGGSLAEVADTARNVVKSMATMGIAMSACTLPGAACPLFSLDAGLVEIGLGVHGEAGLKRIKMAPATELIPIIIKPILETLQLKNGDEIAVFVNNLGGLSQFEQWVVTSLIKQQLGTMGAIVRRLYSGFIMTSLETAGLQVCVLNLSSPFANPNWLRWLDSKTSSPGWPGTDLSAPLASDSDKFFTDKMNEDITTIRRMGPELNVSAANAFQTAIQGAATAIIEHAEELNELDSGCGDGDCGTTLARFCKELLLRLPSIFVKNPASALLQLADMSSSTMGGTSGAVYGLFFSAASDELNKVKGSPTGKDLLEAVARAWTCGVHGIMQYSVARLGDRTLLDALIPASEAFSTSIGKGADGIASLNAAISASDNGCQNTRILKARVGRASYVHSTDISNVDAGAFAVLVWLKGICDAVQKI